MSTSKKRTFGTAAAILIAGTVAYAAAQQQPAHEHEDRAGCPQECKGECMAGGGMMGHGGGMMGMHGDKAGGMMGGGMADMSEGASCPMMDLRALADVQIENTKNGAIIRMNAKKAEQVAQIQKLAQRMTQCMGHAQAAPNKPAVTAPHTR
jgi:hypothetical protein